MDPFLSRSPCRESSSEPVSWNAPNNSNFFRLPVLYNTYLCPWLIPLMNCGILWTETVLLTSILPGPEQGGSMVKWEEQQALRTDHASGSG